MNAEEYKQLITQENVLDHTTLNVTLKELVSRQEFEIAATIKKILQLNQIVKPDFHDKPLDMSTTYYTIELASDDIDKIIDIFSELEAANVGEDGNTTPTASFYSSLVDKWNNLT